MQTQETHRPYKSVDLSRAYHATRGRVADLVRELPDGVLETPVPTCPGWSIRDVVAHLAAGAEDMAAEPMTAPPDDEQTAAQVARFHYRSLPQILADWEKAAAPLDETLPVPALRIQLFDVTSHEHDIRAALSRPGDRDSEAVRISSQILLETMRPPVPLRVVVEDAEFRIGPEEGSELVLTTSRFDTLRWRMGRRSPAQLAAMQWSADPAPVLSRLAVFGPATADVIE